VPKDAATVPTEEREQNGRCAAQDQREQDGRTPPFRARPVCLLETDDGQDDGPENGENAAAERNRQEDFAP